MFTVCMILAYPIVSYAEPTLPGKKQISEAITIKLRAVGGNVLSSERTNSQKSPMTNSLTVYYSAKVKFSKDGRTQGGDGIDAFQACDDRCKENYPANVRFNAGDTAEIKGTLRFDLTEKGYIFANTTYASFTIGEYKFQRQAVAGEGNVNKDKLRIDYKEAISKSNYKKAFKLLKNGCEQGNDNACVQVKASTGYVKGSDNVMHKIDEYWFYQLEGYRYWYRHNFEKSVELFNLAIKLKPKTIRAYYELSQIFIDAKKYTEAFNTADRVMKFDPSAGHTLRAMVLWNQGDTKSSINEMTKGCKIKHNPECDRLDEASLNNLFVPRFNIAGIEIAP